MKKSKLILFSYLGFLALLYLIFYIVGSGLIGGPLETKNKFEQNIIELSDFKIISTTSQTINLKAGDSYSLSVFYLKDSVPPQIQWQISGDTLILKKSEQYDDLTIKIPKGSAIKLISNNTRIWIENIKTDSLLLEALDSQIYGFNNSEVNVLNVTLKNSKLEASQGAFNHIITELNNGKFSIYNAQLKTITGNALNNSKLRFKKTNKVTLNLDDSSTLAFYP